MVQRQVAVGRVDLYVVKGPQLCCGPFSERFLLALPQETARRELGARRVRGPRNEFVI